MSEFHDDYPQYELMAHHSDEAGVAKRKKLWRVFWIMLGITIVELILGFYNEHFPKIALIIIFVSFTIMKAGYIVLSFMHLGDEKKAMKYVILGPFSLFIIYLIFIITAEGTYTLRQAEKDNPSHQEQSIGEH